MKKIFVSLTLLLGLASFLFTSCKDIQDIEDAAVLYEAEYAVPVFKSSVSLKDAIGEIDAEGKAVTIDEDGLIHLVYSDNVIRQESDDILLGFPTNAFPLISNTVEIPFTPPNDVRIDKATLKDSKISFECSSKYNQDVNLVFDLPEMKHPQTGASFSHTTQVKFDGSAPSAANGVMNLAGWNLVPNNGKLTIKYTATLPDGTSVKLDDFFLLFVDFKTTYIEGYTGVVDYDLPASSVDVNLFKQWVAGGVTFENPSLKIKVNNSLGVPVRAKVKTVQISNKDGGTLNLESELLNKMDVNYPSLQEVGQTKTTTFTFDSSNSNINQVLTTKPISVQYDLDAQANPDEDVSSTGFIDESSAFDIGVELDLPVKAQANNFTIQPEDIDLNLKGDYEDVESAVLKLVTENNIPLNGAIQLYFKDENGVVLDSLIDQPLSVISQFPPLKAAGVDANGKSNSTTTTESEFPIPADKAEKFLKAEKLGFVTVFNTASGKFVRLSYTDDVTVKLGMRIKIKS